jgi:hypothetical protein
MKTTQVTITGLDELKRKLAQMPISVNAAAEKQLSIVCEDLRGKAAELAPIDTGDLRGSSYAEVNGLDGVVGFGEIYALRQHEETQLRHPKGGQAKFLEQPYE